MYICRWGRRKYFADGTVQRIEKNGVKAIEYPNGEKEITFPDGMVIKEFPDGRIRKTYSDGKYEISRRSCSVSVLQ